MTTNYPGALDTTAVLKNDATDGTVTQVTHAQQHNNVADAIIAVETELGANPSGGFATVAAAIATLDPSSGGFVARSPGAGQVVLPTADVLALAVRAFNAGQTSLLFEAQNAAGSTVLYIDKLGNFSATSLAVGGTPLASTHLSDSAALARLASPTLTGDPKAPTPATSDNDTSIATTAYVKAQAYATLNSPTFTGTPAAPTAAGGTNTTQIATTAFVQAALSGVVSVRTSSFPVDLRNPDNTGNAWPRVETMTAWESYYWGLTNDVVGSVYGLVRVPENLAGTPAAKIAIEISSSATTGVTSMAVATASVPDGSSLNPASLAFETTQNVTTPATAHARKKVTFTLTTPPAAGDLMIVRVYHAGTDGSDTLAVPTRLHGAWLVCDVT